MFNNPEIRIHGTGSLFPIGQEDLLFHSRMIRPAGRGPDLSTKPIRTEGRLPLTPSLPSLPGAAQELPHRLFQ